MTRNTRKIGYTGNTGEQRGFTLIEVVAALVVAGFISVTLAMLVEYGARGYVTTRTNVSTAEKVQVAMDRIRLEMENMQAITSITKTAGNSSMVFTDRDGTAVTLAMSLATNTITLNGNTLLDNVAGFTLTTLCANMSGGSGVSPDLGTITVSISITNIPNAFVGAVTPRARFACF